MLRFLAVLLCLLVVSCSRAPEPKLGPEEQARFAALLEAADASLPPVLAIRHEWEATMNGLERGRAELNTTRHMLSLATREPEPEPKPDAWAENSDYHAFTRSPRALAASGDGYHQEMLALADSLAAVESYTSERQPFAQPFLGPKWEALRDAHAALTALASEAADPLGDQARPITSTADAEARIWQHAEAVGRARAEFDAAMARFRAE